jgi:uncharacterized protein (DUF58 family)
MTLEEILSEIRYIKSKSKNRSYGNRVGVKDSILQGKGIELDSLREYHIGDSVRDIDWKASSKSDKIYVKKYREDRTSDIYFLLDQSRSMRDFNKLKSLLCLYGSLALSFLKEGDAISTTIFSDKIEFFDKLTNRKGSIIRNIDYILKSDFNVNTNISIAIKNILSSLKKRSTILIISDFIDSNPNLNDQLKMLKYRHRVKTIKIKDPLNISKGYMVRVEDYETGKRSLVISKDLDSDIDSLNIDSYLRGLEI